MSDTWYKEPVELPPYEDACGRLWTLDGRCLNPPPVSTVTTADLLQWVDDELAKVVEQPLV